MSDGDFIFFENKDTPGYDLCCVQGKTIDELKQFCLSRPDCIGFNTIGFMKNFIHDEDNLQTSGYLSKEGQGLYVHRERYKQLKESNKNKYHIEFEGYTFYKNRDSPGYNTTKVDNSNIHRVKQQADLDPNCIAFNTFGDLKYKVLSEIEMRTLNPVTEKGGLYVKNKTVNYRVKMLCNWCSSKQLCTEWYPMCKGDFKWNNIEVTWEDTDIDFYVIINKPSFGEFYIPERTIIFQMEPWCGDSNQNWGVKTWGEWAKPDESKFLQVRTHEKYYNNGFWQLKSTYNELQSMALPKTKGNVISSICSSKYFDPGHIKRIDFLKYIENKNDDVVKLDIYNHDNNRNFKSYRGPHPPGNKDYGIMPYKYYFMAENNVEHNFVTEKLWEPLICECLCFYWGCPNVKEYIDDRAFIELDFDDFEKSFQIVRNAILNDEWSKRLEYIRREKQKVLNYYNFFPTLERIIKHDFGFTTNPSDAEILYRKYMPRYDNEKLSKVMFIHSTTFNNNTEILNELLSLVSESGLMEKLDGIFILNYGDFINKDNLLKKVHIINYSHATNGFEIPTINFIRAFSQFNKDAKILYLHTKGVTHKRGSVMYKHITDWKNMMLHFLVKEHQWCLDLLDIYDTVGCDYLTHPHRHFSGNFWWATASYISEKEPIKSNVRHDAEWWILNSPNVNFYPLFNSETDHYVNPYPSENYDNEETRKRIDSYYGFDHHVRFKCINLERRTDRKEYTSELLKDIGLFEMNDFFKAVDGQKLEPTEEIVRMFTGNDFGNKRAVIGCALSHYTLWKELLADEKYDQYFIIEDDVKTVPNVKFKINHVMNRLKEDEYKDYDVVYFGYTIYNHMLYRYNDKIKTVNGIDIREYDTSLTIGGIFGYLVTKSGAQKFVDYIEKNGIKHGIDYLMFRYADIMDLKHYEVLPRMILSDYVGGIIGVDSDIQYDNNKLF